MDPQILLLFILGFTALTYVLFSYVWGAYVIVVNMKEKRDTVGLNKWEIALGIPHLLLGFPLDIFIRFFYGSVCFRELPRLETFSSQLKRWIERDPNGWRGQKAKTIRQKLLAWYDISGSHGKWEGN